MSQQALVSVCIPQLGRPLKLARTLRLVAANAEWNHEVITRWDDPPPENRGCPTVLHECIEASTGGLADPSGYVCYLGNDVCPEPGFLRIAMECIYGNFPDGIAICGFFDGYWQIGEMYTHFVISKALIPLLGGEVFHRGYYHLACDCELTERCKQMGKAVWCKEAKVYHDHPIQTGAKAEDIWGDPVYRRAYDPHRAQHDRDLWVKRSREIGFPIRENFQRPDGH